MGRSHRSDVEGIIYHVLNRANGRMTLFYKAADFKAFERVLEEAKARYPIKIFSYQIMPNHWHLVVQPMKNGSLSKFIGWLTLTHTQRWNVNRHRIGYGHVYQGRFKSFPVKDDPYFIQLCRYVESNALRAGLVKRAEDWQWSSLWRSIHGTEQGKQLLDSWPIKAGDDYLEQLNNKLIEETIAGIRKSVKKSRPYGNDDWVQDIAKYLGLQSTLKKQGRQFKGS